jgi:hypothetical protein
VIVAAILYIPVQALFGYLYCENNFCPGDKENDYVYTVKDEDGKTWYMVDGRPVSESEYREEHKNWFDYAEKKDDTNGIKK